MRLLPSFFIALATLLTYVFVATLVSALIFPANEFPEVGASPPTTLTETELNDLNAAIDHVYSREERIEAMIRTAAQEYGLDPDHAVILAQCESSLNERAANPISTAKGLYQFTDGTWENIRAVGHQYDAKENIKQFMIWYPIHPEWWECE